MYIPKPPKPGVFPPDYERAPGSNRLDRLRLQRGLNRRQLADQAGLFPSEVFCWCSRNKPIPKTPRIMQGLSKVLEVPQELLWKYFIGKVTLPELPPSKAMMKAALPDSWAKALYPLVGIADHKAIAKVLQRLNAKVLAKK